MLTCLECNCDKKQKTNKEKEALSRILDRHSAPISKTTNSALPDIQSNWNIASDVEKVSLYFIGLETTCDKKGRQMCRRNAKK